MGLFRRSSPEPEPRRHEPPVSPLASASTLPQPTEDWSELENVRAEWAGQLMSERDGLLGWTNGMRMFDEPHPPAQILNIAEYMTRGLAHQLFVPLLSDADALRTCRRVLTLVDQVPAEPAFVAEFGPRLARLALTIIRERGWQPMELGGDGSVTDEIASARPDGLVAYAARCPDVEPKDTWTHFFGA